MTPILKGYLFGLIVGFILTLIHAFMSSDFTLLKTFAIYVIGCNVTLIIKLIDDEHKSNEYKKKSKNNCCDLDVIISSHCPDSELRSCSRNDTRVKRN